MLSESHMESHSNVVNYASSLWEKKKSMRRASINHNHCTYGSLPAINFGIASKTLPIPFRNTKAIFCLDKSKLVSHNIRTLSSRKGCREWIRHICIWMEKHNSNASTEAFVDSKFSELSGQCLDERVVSQCRSSTTRSLRGYRDQSSRSPRTNPGLVKLNFCPEAFSWSKNILSLSLSFIFLRSQTLDNDPDKWAASLQFPLTMKNRCLLTWKLFSAFPFGSWNVFLLERNFWTFCSNPLARIVL